MACRTAIRSVFLTEPWRPFHPNRSYLSISSYSSARLAWPPSCREIRVRDFHGPVEERLRISKCSDAESPPPSSSSSSSSHDDEQAPPQEAVLKAISEVSKVEGRIGQTTNVVIGGTVTDDSSNEWLALDQKVNSYPTVRGFTAIGTGGDDFVHAMIVAVESVLEEPIPQGSVKQKVSSGGKYVSVNIGPVQVVSSEQVQAVYNAMKRDDRMKYFL